ncbi:MAG: type II secretion system F family protein [Xanthobacteraceae bacterium]
MDFLLDLFLNKNGDPTIAVAVMVFLAVTLAAFGAMVFVQSRGAFKRRTAAMAGLGGDGSGAHVPSRTGAETVQKLIESTTKHYLSIDSDNMKVLRRRLVHAAIFDPRAVGAFFLLRALLAVVLGAVGAFTLPMFVSRFEQFVWIFAGIGGLAGYVLPSLLLDKRIKAKRQEYRIGFPDFMDLLVVCADAGLAMEGALERVGRELTESYPSLAANIHMTNLEIRAGRPLSDALEHFGDRLGLDEVRSFATLIQQSEELGSSITEALRVYSEDMRHKRLSVAEEKAYALPAKLSVPLMMFIFPVLFVVILLPAIVRIKMGAY